MIECSNSKWQMATISLSWFKAQDKCALQTNIQLSGGVGLSPSSGVSFFHLRMINWVCHMKGAGLNPVRRKVGGDHLETEGAWADSIEMKGGWKRWRKRSEGTLLNKVTEGERNDLRQTDGRYEEDGSDSLKRYKGMFDQRSWEPYWRGVRVSPDNDQ